MKRRSFRSRSISGHVETGGGKPRCIPVEIEAIRAAIVLVLENNYPLTVRPVVHRLVSLGMMGKSENESSIP
jgi:hypothetical protein